MNGAPTKTAAPTGSRRGIIELLKRQGPLDAQALARQLGVSAMAVRQHLYDMQDKGLIVHREESRPVGRPAKLWQLAPGADAFFPDGHAELSVDLLRAIRQTFGEEGLERLIAVRAAAQQDSYARQMAGKKSLKARLDALAAARTAEGYMAEVQQDEDGALLLVENHCPICAAASACQGLCRAELDVFRATLGSEVEIERTEHIPLGARRCVYRVRPRG